MFRIILPRGFEVSNTKYFGLRDFFFFFKNSFFFLDIKYNDRLGKILLVYNSNNFNSRTRSLDKLDILFKLLIFIKFICLFYISLDYICYYNNLIL